MSKLSEPQVQRSLLRVSLGVLLLVPLCFFFKCFLCLSFLFPLLQTRQLSPEALLVTRRSSTSYSEQPRLALKAAARVRKAWWLWWHASVTTSKKKNTVKTSRHMMQSVHIDTAYYWLLLVAHLLFNKCHVILSFNSNGFWMVLMHLLLYKSHRSAGFAGLYELTGWSRACAGSAQGSYGACECHEDCDSIRIIWIHLDLLVFGIYWDLLGSIWGPEGSDTSWPLLAGRLADCMSRHLELAAARQLSLNSLWFDSGHEETKWYQGAAKIVFHWILTRNIWSRIDVYSKKPICTV